MSKARQQSTSRALRRGNLVLVDIQGEMTPVKKKSAYSYKDKDGLDIFKLK